MLRRSGQAPHCGVEKVESVDRRCCSECALINRGQLPAQYRDGVRQQLGSILAPCRVRGIDGGFSFGQAVDKCDLGESSLDAVRAITGAERVNLSFGRNYGSGTALRSNSKAPRAHEQSGGKYASQGDLSDVHSSSAGQQQRCIYASVSATGKSRLRKLSELKRKLLPDEEAFLSVNCYFSIPGRFNHHAKGPGSRKSRTPAPRSAPPAPLPALTPARKV